MDFFVNSPVRGFKMPDSLLVQKCDDIVQSANRDIIELETYGVTSSILATIVAKRDEFAFLPTDYMLSGAMMMATEAKNNKHKQLETNIRRIADRIRLKYGEGHGMYASLGVTLLSRQPSHELIRTGRSVVATCTQYLTELNSEGISVPLLIEITDHCTQLDELIDAKIQAVKNRDLAVFNRITCGNELYAMMVNLAGKGKSCWYGINEAKHNDYIMYPGSSSNKQQQIEGNVGSETVINLSATGIEATTELTMSNTGTAPLHFFFAPSPTDTSGSAEIVIPPSEIISRSAAELGYSPQAVRFNVFNPSPSAGSYTVEW